MRPCAFSGSWHRYGTRADCPVNEWSLRPAIQDTEGTVGPYELHDFFLYHFQRYGAPPEKILFLASQASFSRSYTPAEIRRWGATGAAA